MAPVDTLPPGMEAEPKTLEEMVAWLARDIAAKFDQIEEKLDNPDQRTAALVGQLSVKLDEVNRKLDQLSAEQEQEKKRLERVQADLSLVRGGGGG